MQQDSDQLQIDLESFPDELRPMQAASAEAPFSSPDYVFEVKWDGLRCIVFRYRDGAVRLLDRGLHNLTADLPARAAPPAGASAPPTTKAAPAIRACARGSPAAPSSKTRSRPPTWRSTRCTSK